MTIIARTPQRLPDVQVTIPARVWGRLAWHAGRSGRTVQDLLVTAITSVIGETPAEPEPSVIGGAGRRDLVTQAFHRGLSDEEIAAELGITVRQVVRDRNRAGLRRDRGRKAAA